MSGAGNMTLTAKLDMSLDDVIAASPPSYNRRSNRNKGGRGDDKRSDRPRFKRNGGAIRKRRGGGDFWGPRNNGDFPGTRRFKTITYNDDMEIEITPEDKQDEMMISDGEIPSNNQQKRVSANRRFAQALNIGGRRGPKSLAAIEGRHVRIAGLDYSILTSDLEELFQSIGAVEKCWIDFDRTDRSLGTGGVIFKSPFHAKAAVQKFDGRLIDGQPLQLEIAGYVQPFNYIA